MIRAMRGLVQRVSEASVSVDGEVVGRIGPGLCVLVGVGLNDDQQSADRLAAKIWQMRLFPDSAGNLNRSAAELGLPCSSSASSRCTQTPAEDVARRS